MKTSEFDLIKKIRGALLMSHPDLIKGIGDDCAVVKKEGNQVLLISTDSLVERIHFDLKYFTFFELGRKSMAVNLSDIAAMAGKPLYAFVSLAIPKHIQQEQIMDFYAGLEQMAQEFETAIIGGDTSRSDDQFFINVTVIGEALKSQVKYRSSAKVGDGIYVSGCLGSSAVGLRLLQKNKKVENAFIQAHKNPRPRLRLADVVKKYPEVHGMIDLSDGLLQDLNHVLVASEVGAQIDYDKIPREKDFEDFCKQLKLDPIETLLSGGEDYQVLFTMDDKIRETLQNEFVKKKIKVTQIGKIVEKYKGVHPAKGLDNIRVFNSQGQEIVVKRLGFDHFTD